MILLFIFTYYLLSIAPDISNSHKNVTSILSSASHKKKKNSPKSIQFQLQTHSNEKNSLTENSQELLQNSETDSLILKSPQEYITSSIQNIGFEFQDPSIQLSFLIKQQDLKNKRDQEFSEEQILKPFEYITQHHQFQEELILNSPNTVLSDLKILIKENEHSSSLNTLANDYLKQTLLKLSPHYFSSLSSPKKRTQIEKVFLTIFENLDQDSLTQPYLHSILPQYKELQPTKPFFIIYMNFLLNSYSNQKKVIPVLNQSQIFWQIKHFYRALPENERSVVRENILYIEWDSLFQRNQVEVLHNNNDTPIDSIKFQSQISILFSEYQENLHKMPQAESMLNIISTTILNFKDYIKKHNNHPYLKILAKEYLTDSILKITPYYLAYLYSSEENPQIEQIFFKLFKDLFQDPLTQPYINDILPQNKESHSLAPCYIIYTQFLSNTLMDESLSYSLLERNNIFWQIDDIYSNLSIEKQKILSEERSYTKIYSLLQTSSLEIIMDQNPIDLHAQQFQLYISLIFETHQKEIQQVTSSNSIIIPQEPHEKLHTDIERVLKYFPPRPEEFLFLAKKMNNYDQSLIQAYSKNESSISKKHLLSSLIRQFFYLQKIKNKKLDFISYLKQTIPTLKDPTFWLEKSVKDIIQFSSENEIVLDQLNSESLFLIAFLRNSKTITQSTDSNSPEFHIDNIIQALIKKSLLHFQEIFKKHFKNHKKSLHKNISENIKSMTQALDSLVLLPQLLKESDQIDIVYGESLYILSEYPQSIQNQIIDHIEKAVFNYKENDPTSTNFEILFQNHLKQLASENDNQFLNKCQKIYHLYSDFKLKSNIFYPLDIQKKVLDKVSQIIFLEENPEDNFKEVFNNHIAPFFSEILKKETSLHSPDIEKTPFYRFCYEVCLTQKNIRRAREELSLSTKRVDVSLQKENIDDTLFKNSILKQMNHMVSKEKAKSLNNIDHNQNLFSLYKQTQELTEIYQEIFNLFSNLINQKQELDKDLLENILNTYPLSENKKKVILERSSRTFKNMKEKQLSLEIESPLFIVKTFYWRQHLNSLPTSESVKLRNLFEPWFNKQTYDINKVTTFLERLNLSNDMKKWTLQTISKNFKKLTQLKKESLFMIKKDFEINENELIENLPTSHPLRSETDQLTLILSYLPSDLEKEEFDLEIQNILSQLSQVSNELNQETKKYVLSSSQVEYKEYIQNILTKYPLSSSIKIELENNCQRLLEHYQNIYSQLLIRQDKYLFLNFFAFKKQLEKAQQLTLQSNYDFPELNTQYQNFFKCQHLISLFSIQDFPHSKSEAIPKFLEAKKNLHLPISHTDIQTAFINEEIFQTFSELFKSQTPLENLIPKLIMDPLLQEGVFKIKTQQTIEFCQKQITHILNIEKDPHLEFEDLFFFQSPIKENDLNSISTFIHMLLFLTPKNWPQIFSNNQSPQLCQNMSQLLKYLEKIILSQPLTNKNQYSFRQVIIQLNQLKHLTIQEEIKELLKSPAHFINFSKVYEGFLDSYLKKDEVDNPSSENIEQAEKELISLFCSNTQLSQDEGIDLLKNIKLQYFREQNKTIAHKLTSIKHYLKGKESTKQLKKQLLIDHKMRKQKDQEIEEANEGFSLLDKFKKSVHDYVQENYNELNESNINIQNLHESIFQSLYKELTIYMEYKIKGIPITEQETQQDIRRNLQGFLGYITISNLDNLTKNFLDFILSEDYYHFLNHYDTLHHVPISPYAHLYFPVELVDENILISEKLEFFQTIKNSKKQASYEFRTLRNQLLLFHQIYLSSFFEFENTLQEKNSLLPKQIKSIPILLDELPLNEDHIFEQKSSQTPPLSLETFLSELSFDKNLILYQGKQSNIYPDFQIPYDYDIEKKGLPQNLHPINSENTILTTNIYAFQAKFTHKILNLIKQTPPEERAQIQLQITLLLSKFKDDVPSYFKKINHFIYTAIANILNTMNFKFPQEFPIPYNNKVLMPQIKKTPLSDFQSLLYQKNPIHKPPLSSPHTSSIEQNKLLDLIIHPQTESFSITLTRPPNDEPLPEMPNIEQLLRQQALAKRSIISANKSLKRSA